MSYMDGFKLSAPSRDSASSRIQKHDETINSTNSGYDVKCFQQPNTGSTNSLYSKTTGFSVSNNNTLQQQDVKPFLQYFETPQRNSVQVNMLQQGDQSQEKEQIKKLNSVIVHKSENERILQQRIEKLESDNKKLVELMNKSQMNFDKELIRNKEQIKKLQQGDFHKEMQEAIYYIEKLSKKLEQMEKIELQRIKANNCQQKQLSQTPSTIDTSIYSKAEKNNQKYEQLLKDFKQLQQENQEIKKEKTFIQKQFESICRDPKMDIDNIFYQVQKNKGEKKMDIRKDIEDIPLPSYLRVLRIQKHTQDEDNNY